MSWSFSFVVPRGAESFDEQAFGAESLYRDSQASFGNDVSLETGDQIKAAIAAAKALVDSKALGEYPLGYNVTLTGHANIDHKPTPGYASDQVTVHVRGVE